MRTKLKQSGILVCGALLFSACTGQPSIPKVDELEVGKYEKAYMDEYNTFLVQYKDYKKPMKWI
ncbi:hypothetical protein [Sulfurimonas denitrificans]|uniref:hypothetical protein n=1 Tax=Sulfurimonas denitrificans TaxID=39766 RepID=UPI0005A0AD2A|nr:hypothetical protein [Sulfurimonas denitrificans]